MLDGLAMCLGRESPENTIHAFGPLVDLARAYVGIRALGLGGEEPGRRVDDVSRLLEGVGAAVAERAALSSAVATKISFLAELLWLELFLQDIIRQPEVVDRGDDYGVLRLKGSLMSLRRDYRGYPAAADLIADASARAALALAAVGAEKLALKVALDLKGSVPYGRTVAALEVLNPESFARYAEVHPSYAEAGLKRERTTAVDGGMQLFAMSLESGSGVGDGRDDPEEFQVLRTSREIAGALIAYVTEGSLFSAWRKVCVAGLPAPDYVIVESGRRIYADDGGEWRELTVPTGRPKWSPLEAGLRLIARREGIGLERMAYDADGATHELPIVTTRIIGDDDDTGGPVIFAASLSLKPAHPAADAPGGR